MQDEGYPPPAEMPIKKLEFTPFKPPPAAKVSDAGSKESAEDAEAAEAEDGASSTGDAAAAATDAAMNINVFLRVRPLAQDFTGDATLTVVDRTSVALCAPPVDPNQRDYKGDVVAVAEKLELSEQDKYKFTQVFGTDAQQADLYAATAEPLVKALIEGQNGLVFAYGPTNSGKTFTIQGGKDEQAGILPRSLTSLFDLLAGTEEGGKNWTVWVTYMEIYNENVYDLLDAPPDKTKNEPRKVCKLKEHNGQVHVKGLRELQVRSVDEARQVLRYGARHRQVAETMSNDVSSRSHSVFNIKLVPNRGADTDPTDPSQVFSKLAIVDLAGSERALKTRATGERLKEASNINVSLMNLGRCLEALRWNQLNPNKVAHVVPFRHSKLTRIFQDHFLTGSRMLMIVAVNPHPGDFDEARQALQYGAIAKEISVRKTMNTRKPAPMPKKKSEEKVEIETVVETVVEEWEEVQIDDLVNELESMRAAMYQLEAKNAQLEEKVREEVCDEMMKQMQEMERSFEVRMEDERIATEQKFERKLQIIAREVARREESLTEEEIREMQSQLKFYELRVADMQREHKNALQRLLPGGPSCAAQAEEASAEGMDAESAGQMRQRMAVLEAQVAALQKETEEKDSALEVKRRQQNESRLVLEEADSVIRQLESKVKGLEDQNDRLREELKVRRAQQAPDEPQVDTAMSDRVQELERALVAEKLQTAELEKQTADMKAVLTKKQRQTLGVAAQESKPPSSDQMPTIAGLQVRDSEVGVGGEESVGSKRKSNEGEKGNGAKKGKGKKPEPGKGIDDCDLRTLEYLMPDDDSYMRPSSALKSSRPAPMSPSMANIKANTQVPLVIPAASKMAPDGGPGTTGKSRKLYTANDDKAVEELNEAAGSTVAEPTPVRRTTRSSRAGAFTTLLM